MLKPLDVPLEQLRWYAETFESVDVVDLRIARPRRARDGSLVVEGWTASTWLPGVHKRRWRDVIDAGKRLHDAVVHVPRPSFLDRASDRWSIADRAVWSDGLSRYASVKHVNRLAAALRPVRGASQLVHADLTGNVLFADPLPPAVIDFSPSWRPRGYAYGIVVGDALAWEGADESILDAVADVHEFPQYLLRALLFRIVVDHLFRPDEPPRPDANDPFRAPVELALRLARSERP